MISDDGGDLFMASTLFGLFSDYFIYLYLLLSFTLLDMHGLFVTGIGLAIVLDIITLLVVLTSGANGAFIQVSLLLLFWIGVRLNCGVAELCFMVEYFMGRTVLI